MTKRIIVTLVLLTACGTLTNVCAQEPAKRVDDKIILKVEGELTRVDPVDPVLKKGFHKVYSVKLTGGEHYQIDLVSKDFDSYLRLENSQGKRLAEDDDSGGDLNACVLFKAVSSESFRIIVTTYDVGKAGKFLLTVKVLDKAAFEREQLLHRANAVTDEGLGLYRQGKLPDATDRFRKALDLIRQAYPKAKYPQGHADLASGLNNLGSMHQYQGEYVKAEPLLREALAMREGLYPKAKHPNGHSDLAQSLNNVGFLLRDQGEFAKAEPYLRDALAMNEALYARARFPHGHPELAASLNNLGLLLQDQGEYAKAEQFSREALAMYQSLYSMAKYPQGHPDLASALDNLGTLLAAQGDHAKAELLYRNALAMRYVLYPKAKFPLGHPDLAISLSNMGLLLQNQGEYAKAKPLFDDALLMQQAFFPKARYPHGHPALAGVLSNLGGLYQAQEDYAKAEPYWRDALRMREALYPKAKYPQGHPDLALSLNSLAGMHWGRGEYVKAEQFYRDALTMQQLLYPNADYPLGHPNLATNLNNLSLVLRHQGEYAKAERMGRDALSMREAIYPSAKYPQGHPHLAFSLSNLGSLLLVQKEPIMAEPFLRKALAMFTQLASRTAESASEPVALNTAATYSLARDVLLSATGQVAGSDTRTYAAIWDSRAAITRVYQRRHLTVIAAATDESVRKSWNELQKLRREREQLIMAPLVKDPSSRKAKLSKLNEQIETAERELVPQLPVLKHYTDLAKLGPEALQKLLPKDTVLVDFLRYIKFNQNPKNPGKKGEERAVRYLAFVISHDQIHRVELDAAADVDTAVRTWHETIKAKVPGGNDSARKEHEAKLARQAVALRKMLWEPIEKQLPQGTATVYLAPDADLTRLPWGALPGKGKDRVLLDDYALAVLQHGPFLLEQLTPPPPRSAKRLPAPEGFLLVGGIRYDDKPSVTFAANHGEDVVDQKVVWSGLTGTNEERLLLTKLLQTAGPKLTASLSDSAAATDRLRHELERCRYAHIATHGFFADAKHRSVLQLDPKLFDRTISAEGQILQRVGAGARSPLVLSGLVCAGANLPDTPERGILSADAIAGLLLDDLHLAVLSACDTGIGDVAGGEGVFGLQRAFHIAGCKNVVASLWKVDDAATAALMTRFYGYLFSEDKSKRLPPIESLRRAQLDIYRHPELIPAWATGDQRAPGKPRPATTPPPQGTPHEFLTSDGRTPIRLWAAFTLSGTGH